MFTSPITQNIVHFLSQGNALGPEDHEMDFGNLPGLDGHDDDLIDFGNLLSTDDMVPSSSPKNGTLAMTFEYDSGANNIADWMETVMKGFK
jgi:hypothetical protein